MLTVGMDVHQGLSVLCVLDRNGKEVWTRTVRGYWNKAIEVLKAIDEPLQICVEASCGYGPVHDALARVARRVVVAHPGHLRLIFRSKQKNDRADAKKLATLLYLDQVPPVHVPVADVRGWRALIEHRRRLIDRRTKAKNGLRAALRYLMAAFEEASEGADHCITRYRDPSVNLRTQLTKIIKRAGLEPWPKLWHNLRSTRETELAESFPAHAVSAWIGHGPQVALKHYLQVTDDHFERAAGQAQQNAQQHLTALGRNGTQDVRGGTADDAVRRSASSDEGEVGHTGLEPVTSRV